ncbi:MAG: YcxB family protein [Methylococcales bacterium]|nr:YcxB family protein [Methylococcales bacterium]
MYTIDYELREEDFIHFNERLLHNTDHVKASIRKNRWYIPAFLLFVAAFYYYYYGDTAASGYIVFLAALWTWLSPRLILLNLRQQITKSYSHKEKNKMLGNYHLSMDAEHLIEKSPSGKHKYPWSEVLRVEREKDQYVYLYVDVDTALVIPVETLKSGDIKAFSKHAEKMIERFA